MRTERMRSKAIASCALVIAGILIAVPAAAQSPGSASSSASGPSAEKLFEEGMKASKDEDWPSAYKALSKAWELKQHWKIAANLGRAELELGKDCDAFAHIKHFLDNAPSLSDSDRKQAESMRDRASSKIGRLTVRVNVDGADVLIDGNFVGRSPLPEPVCVKAGNREGEARRQRYQGLSVTRSVKPHSSHDLQINMRVVEASFLVSKVVGSAPSESRAKPNNTLMYWGIAATVTMASAGTVSAIVSQITSSQSQQYDRGQPQDNQICYEELQNTSAILTNISI